MDRLLAKQSRNGFTMFLNIFSEETKKIRSWIECNNVTLLSFMFCENIRDKTPFQVSQPLSKHTELINASVMQTCWSSSALRATLKVRHCL